MPETCATCGNVLPANAPRGFCPTCLLRGGITAGDDEVLVMPARIDEQTTRRDPIVGGRYRLGEKLGEGGFGIVYEAEQTEPIRRTVALKVLKVGVAGKQVIARFEAERQTLALMNHEHIARVLDAGETADGRPFFVMERVVGRPVTTFVRDKRLPLIERLTLFTLICDAVHHAHQKGIIHRDLKPSNVLVEVDAGRPRPKVIDFGIAKALEGPLTDHTLFTAVDQMLGTPGYMSPEQIEQDALIDTRSDVYALGALLYEMLCDAPVVDPASFAGKPVGLALRELASRPPPKPSLRNHLLRGDLDAIIVKALQSEPAMRYASADAMAEDVRRFLRFEPIIARPPSTWYLAKKFARRHRAGVIAAVIVLLAILAGTLISTRLYFETQAANVEAERDKSRFDAQRLETQRSYSRSDFLQACQSSDNGRHGDAIALLCRAIRTDPANDAASTYLASMLGHVHISRVVSPLLRPPPRYDQLPFIGCASDVDQAVAVSTSSKNRKLPQLFCRWNFETGDHAEWPLPEATTARSLVTTPDDTRALIGLSDGRVMLADLEKPELRESGIKMGAAVSALVVSNDGTHVLCGSESGDVQLFDLKSAKPAGPVLTLRLGVKQLAMGVNERVAAAWSGDAVVVFDAVDARQIGAPKRMRDLITFALQPQGSCVALGSADGFAELRQVSSGDLLSPPFTLGGAVSSVAFSAEGKTLIIGDDAGFLQSCSSRTGALRGTANRMESGVLLCRATSEQGRMIAVSGDGELRLWNPLGAVIASHRARTKVTAAALNGSGTNVVVSDGKTLRVWEMHGRVIERRLLGTDQEMPACARPLRRAAPEALGDVPFHWNAAGTHTAISTKEGIVVNPGDKPPIRPLSVTAFALSNSGQVVAVAQKDRSVRLWRVGEAQPLPMVLRHNEEVQHIAFHPDDSMVATVTEDGEFRFWDAVTGAPLTPAINRGTVDPVVGLVFDTGGGALVFQRAEGGWFALPTPFHVNEMPAWFLGLAEAFGRRHLNDDSSPVSLDHTAIASAMEHIPKEPGESEQPLVTLARWLCANPTKRSLWPGDRVSFAGYLEQLGGRDDGVAAREVLRFRPANAAAIAKLRVSH